MTRFFTHAWIGLTSLAMLGLTPTAFAADGDEVPEVVRASDSDDSSLDAGQIAHHGPRWHPRRRRYRRYAPRRVYRQPRYVGHPRRGAERQRRPVFHVGLALTGNSLLGDDGSFTGAMDSGGGFGLELGMRVAPRWSLDINGQASFHDVGAGGIDSATLSSVGVDLRYFLSGWNNRLQPYLQLGVGAYMLSASDSGFDETLSGPGFQAGGGVDIYLTRAVSIGGKLLYRGAMLEHDSFGGSVEAGSLGYMTFGGDVKFHF